MKTGFGTTNKLDDLCKKSDSIIVWRVNSNLINHLKRLHEQDLTVVKF